MESEWKNWCRLCGNEEDKTNIVLTLKDEDFSKLADTIKNLLSITMTNFDETRPKICTICRDLLFNFMEFSTRAEKVQELFAELQVLEGNHEYQLDINILRNKYGLKQINKTTEISTIIEDNDLFQKIKKMNIELKNIDVICPDNIKSENILDDQFNNETQQEQLYTRKTITCEICSKQFLRQGNLTAHLKFAHSIQNKKKLLPCEICRKTFSTQQKLTAHCRIHMPIEERATHQCPHCQQKLSCKANLKQHIRSKHTGEKTFICDQCGKSFTTKQAMKLHKYVHDKDNEFQCRNCTKIFKNELRLKVHMKVHRDKMYPCSICGLQLKTSKTLKNHLIIHTDEMPFNCNYCGATFRRDKSLRAHMIIHTGLRPYECPFCSQSYANRSNCKKHQKHSHPEAFAAMEASGIQHYTKNVPNLSQLKTILEQMKSEIQCSQNS